MLNTPNEWHNEEETSEDEYEEDEYEEDDGEEDDGEEYEEEYEEDEESTDDGAGKKKLLIAAGAAILILLLILGGIFGIKAMKSRSTPADKPVTETAVIAEGETAETGEAGEVPPVAAEAGVDENGEEIAVIDIESDGTTPEVGAEAPTEGGVKEDKLKADESSGIEIEADDEIALGGKSDGTVTVSVGDVGRTNPFEPTEASKAKGQTLGVTEDEEGYDFEIIEPPTTASEPGAAARLLSTKVAGILYDKERPSAIINIDGVDQLVRVGDILSDFEIVNITQSKVVIRDGNNVYRASVGQPVHSEKLGTVEIYNLDEKFAGAYPKKK